MDLAMKRYANIWCNQDTLGAKTQKGDYIDQKPNLRSFKWLKRAFGLKTCFRGAFDKLLVFVDRKYHTWDTLDAKTQKADYKDQKPNLRFFCVSFRAKTSNWA